MYAWWYVVIVLAVLIVVGAVMLVVGGNHYSDWMINIGTGVLCIGLCDIVVLPVTWITDAEAKKEVKSFEYQRVYIEQTINNAGIFENFAINQTIIEQNQWLSKAKADIDEFGVWSAYYYTEVRDLEPIAIKRGE